MHAYLPWLMRRVLEAGGRLVQKTVSERELKQLQVCLDYVSKI